MVANTGKHAELSSPARGGEPKGSTVGQVRAREGATGVELRQEID